MVASRSGPSQPARAGRGGSSWTIRYIPPITLSPRSYGGRPSRTWNIVAPNDQTSEASSPRAPAATSGARYAGDPVTMPVCVRAGSVAIRAMPKSVSFTWPARSTMMFDGLTSRCTIPAECAAARAPAAWASRGAASSGESGPRSRTRRPRSTPSTYSITSHQESSSTTASKIETTCGWCSRALTLASRSARVRSVRSAPGSRPIRLSATGRPSTSSRPSQTAPVPPRPISRSSEYRPAITRAFRSGSCVGAVHRRGAAQTSPVRWAKMAAWTRSRRVSLASTLATWVLVVGMLTTRRSQISALVRP